MVLRETWAESVSEKSLVSPVVSEGEIAQEPH